MPNVEDYAALAPFTLEELVAAANAVLRDRPTLQIQGRTVRYYISQGLLPSPSGGPKYARYVQEHLLRIVSIRQWLDKGISLEQAAEWIREGRHGGETDTLLRKPTPRIRESVAELKQSPIRSSKSVVKLSLTEFSTLETDASVNYLDELEQVAQALQEEIKSLNDITRH